MGRQSFSPKDIDNAARFLLNYSPQDRGKPSVHEALARAHPEHPWSSWHTTYHKSNGDNIRARIKALRLEAKGKGKAEPQMDAEAEEDGGKDDEVDQLETDEENRHPLEDEDGDESSESSDSSGDEDRRAPTRRKVKYTEQDDFYLIKALWNQMKNCTTKQSMYKELARKHPDHSYGSWQTRHRDTRDYVDRWATQLYEGRKTKADLLDELNKRSRDRIQSGASTALPPPVPAHLLHSREQRSPAAASRKEKKLRSSGGLETDSDDEEDDRRRVKHRRSDVSEGKAPLFRRNESVSTNGNGSVDAPAPVASTSRLAAVAAPPPVVGASTPAHEPPRSKSVEASKIQQPVAPASSTTFDETDEEALVHELALAEFEDRERADAWPILATKHPRHTAEQWKAHFVGNKVRFLLNVAERSKDLLLSSAAPSTESTPAPAPVAPIVEHDAMPHAAKKATPAAVPIPERSPAKSAQTQRTTSPSKSPEPISALASVLVSAPIAVSSPRQQSSTTTRTTTTPRGSPEKPIEHAAVAAIPDEDATVIPASDVESEERLVTNGVDVAPVPPAPTFAAASSTMSALTASDDPSPPTPSATPPRDVPQDDNQDGEMTDRITEEERLKWTPSPFLDTNQDYLDKSLTAQIVRVEHQETQTTVAVMCRVGLEQPLASVADELRDADDRRMDAQLRAAAAEAVAPEGDPSQEPVGEGAKADQQETRKAELYALDEATRTTERNLARLQALFAHEIEAQQSEERKHVEAEEMARRKSAAEQMVRAGQEKRKREEKMRKEKEERQRREREREDEERRREKGQATAAAEAAQEMVARVAEIERRKASEEQAAAKRSSSIPRSSPAPPPHPTSGDGDHRRSPSLASSTIDPTSSRKRPRASLEQVSSSRMGTPQEEVAEPDHAKRPKLASPTTSIKPEPTELDPARHLKQTFKSYAQKYGLKQRKVCDLYFAISAPYDFQGLDQACGWFAATKDGMVTHRPSKGTAEYDALRKWVERNVWSYDDDTVVLEGSEGAHAKIDQKRGRNATRARRRFLSEYGFTNVGALEKRWPFA